MIFSVYVTRMQCPLFVWLSLRGPGLDHPDTVFVHFVAASLKTSQRSRVSVRPCGVQLCYACKWLWSEIKTPVLSHIETVCLYLRLVRTSAQSSYTCGRAPNLRAHRPSFLLQFVGFATSPRARPPANGIEDGSRPLPRWSGLVSYSTHAGVVCIYDLSPLVRYIHKSSGGYNQRPTTL